MGVWFWLEKNNLQTEYSLNKTHNPEDNNSGTFPVHRYQILSTLPHPRSIIMSCPPRNVLGAVEKMEKSKTKPRSYAARFGCVIEGNFYSLGGWKERGEKEKRCKLTGRLRAENANMVSKRHKRT